MDNSCYLSILLCWCLMFVVNGLTDITTVYEINTFTSDLEDVKYLNTCTVSVHVPAVLSQLPLFSSNSNNSIMGKNIPPLYSTPNLTKWKRLDGSDILVSYIEEYMLNFTKFNMNLTPLSHITLQTEIHRTSTFVSGTMFNESVMADLYNNADTLPFNTISVHFRRTEHTRTQLYWDSNDSHFIEITTQNGNKLTVCYYNEKTECKEFKFSFYSTTKNESALLITLYGELIISDQLSPEIINTSFHLPKGFTRYTRIKDVHDSIWNTLYYFYQTKPTHIASPWLEMKSSTAVFMFYFAQLGHSITTSLEDETTKSVVQLDGIELDRVYYTEELERVLAKVNIPSWTGKKRIRVDGNKTVMVNIWEQTELDRYKIKGPKSCAKSNTMDIYNTLERGSLSEPVDICFNGGRLKNTTCAYPPGFAGNQCELACGRNRFGQTCSSVCSKYSNECKGMILCTPDYGCTCAPGYHGNQCIQQCQEGTYGADCTQTCDHCKNGCDRYTGACRGNCSKPFLIRPYCKQTHSYLKKAAEIVDTSFNSVQLQVDLTPNNVVRSSANVMTYLVQYREDNNSLWNNGPSEVFSPIMSDIMVKGLNPGRSYEFKVLLIDETRENQNPLLSKTTKGQTKCSVSVKEEYLNIDTISNTSIGLSWDNETGPRNTECPTKNYILEVDELTDTGYVKTREFFNIKRNSYQLETSPGQTYHIKLKKITLNGDTVTISRKNITTEDTADLSNEVVGVTIKKTNSQIKIDWFPIPIYKKYFVKYKLTRYMSCNEDNMKSSLETIETTNTTTNLSLLNLEPYAYYELFVTVDKNQMMKEFNSSFITPCTIPTDSPTLSSALTKVTNDSIHLSPTNYSDSCERMNGVFMKYRIELFDSQKLIQSYETEDDNQKLDITGLESETQYLVKIYFVNQVGFNPTVSLQHNFTTKPNTLVRELTAYKTTPTMIGLRLKVLDISTILAINIELRSEIGNKTINILTSSLHSLQCKPWPGFYCIEVTELMENNKYCITVDAFSKDLPEGSVSKPILAVTKETTPSAVSEITLKYSSNTNMTLSWRIPFTLNGTLRSFDIQLEQLSSFDDKICCQINKTVYPVSEEQEIYSLTLQDMKPSSSYQITIRPLARRLGPEVKEIIETPPPRIPFQHVPLVRIDDIKIEFPIQHNKEDSDNVYKTLATEILIIKQILKGETNETSETTDSIRADLSQILGSKNWVLVHVCKVADVNCSVDIKTVSNDTDYSFKILLVQVNEYLSAKSYTILESAHFPLL